MTEKKEGKFIQRLKKKFRLIAYSDSTFEEIWAIRISKMKIILLWISLFVVILGISFVIVAFTPLRKIIPGYPEDNIRYEILSNVEKLDSLDYKMKIYEQYLLNLKTIINGEEPNNYDNHVDTNTIDNTIKSSNTFYDSSLFMNNIKEEQYGFSDFQRKNDNRSLSSIHFFTPIKGYITNSFNPVENHFGTDIVADANEVVKAVLGGTVIMSAWTLETGYVIQIQHENELISVYKHNAELLKAMGNYVEVGEAIAIIGNSGELTTGPHLHFELWYRGMPLNPEDYITF